MTGEDVAQAIHVGDPGFDEHDQPRVILGASGFISFPKLAQRFGRRHPSLETPFPTRHPPPMRSRYTVRETERAHFITSTIVDWLPVFHRGGGGD